MTPIRSTPSRATPPVRTSSYKAILTFAAATTVVLPAARASAAELMAAGLNAYGQIGNGTVSANTGSGSPNVFVPVTGMNFGITADSGGGGHSLAARHGTLYAWGLTNYGQLGNGASGGGSDGTGIYKTPTPQPALLLTSGVTSVTGGLYFSMAIANGALYSFGGNFDGVLANGTANNSVNATPAVVTGLSSGVTAASAGTIHALAIKDGALYGWGSNTYGQAGNGSAGSGTPNVTTATQVVGMSGGVSLVAAGTYHSLAVKNGVLYAWGDNTNGAVGNGAPVGRVTENLIGTPTAVLGLPAGGTITDLAAGGSSPNQINVGFSLALVNGAVYAWGANDRGQLGDSTGEDRSTAATVPGITGTITDIAAGSAAGYALGADGSLWSWGANQYGQLGVGSTSAFISTPQHTFAPAGYRFSSVEAAANAQHVLVTRSALPVYFKGANGNSLADVANYATTVAGTTAAPIAPVESTDIFFGTTNATVANLTTTVGSGMVANSLTFGTGVSATNAVTLNGTGPITLYADKNTYAANTGIVVQSASAAVTINAPVTLGWHQSWTNNAAAPLTVNGPVAMGAQSLALAGTGNITLNGSISGSGAVTITAGGTTTLGGANTYTGGTTVNNTSGTVHASPAAASTLLGGAGTDIARGRVSFDYSGASPMSTIRSLLTSGYANGFASGTLRSSTANAQRGLGYADTGSAVVVVATLYGDANLNGVVDFNDFLVLQNNFGSSNTTFGQGNFNYDGQTDFNDFLVLQNNFGQSLSGAAVALTSSQVAAITAFANANVPEPTCLAIAALGGLAMLRRRRLEFNRV